MTSSSSSCRTGTDDEVGGFDRERQQAEVAGARPQHRNRAFGAADRDLEVEVRMDAAHFGQQRREDVEADRHAADQPDGAAQRFALVADAPATVSCRS